MPDLRTIARDITTTNIVNALVAFVFAASGPVAIILAVGANGKLSQAELASWVFGAFFINGIISLVFCLRYRQPLVFFWTIPGTVLLKPALEHLSFVEVIGAFYATGALMLILGASGLVKRCMNALPMPIVMGMVAGVFLQFALDWIGAFKQGFWIVLPMTIAYFALLAAPGAGKRLPPLIGTLIVGVIAVALSGDFAPKDPLVLRFAAPQIFVPVFSWQAMVELVIPLLISVLAVQNGQGIAVVTAAGHRPPINNITMACGVGSLVGALVGTVSSCLTGPVNAILASSGAREKQYAGGVLVAIFALIFGIIAPTFTIIMLAAPQAFIAALAGIAMLPVLQNAFKVSFQGRFTLGAFIALIVTVSNISILNISAPFWGLVFGGIASWLIEREDFHHPRPG